MDETSPPNSNSPESPPSPPPVVSRSSSGVWAAKLTLWFPFAGLFVLLALGGVFGKRDDIGVRGLIAMCGIPSLIFAGGLALGIKTLRRMKIDGRKGIFGRAVTGVVFSGLLLCATLSLMGFGIHVQEFIEKQKEQEASDAEKMKEMVALRDVATKEFSLKIREMAKKYQTSGMALLNPPVLDITSVKSREDLKIREEMIGQHIAYCNALQELAEHGTELYRQELLKRNVSRGLQEASVKKFAETFSDANPRTMALRQADVRQGEAMLKIVTILDAAWGKWEYTPDKQKIEFKDTNQLSVYNSATEEFYKASEDAQRIKQQLPQKNIEK